MRANECKDAESTWTPLQEKLTYTIPPEKLLCSTHCSHTFRGHTVAEEMTKLLDVVQECDKYVLSFFSFMMESESLLAGS